MRKSFLVLVTIGLWTAAWAQSPEAGKEKVLPPAGAGGEQGATPPADGRSTPAVDNKRKNEGKEKQKAGAIDGKKDKKAGGKEETKDKKKAAAAGAKNDDAKVKKKEEGADALNHPFTKAFWLVFSASTLATFVASVMASEQEQRLRNGTFGAIAGTSVGALAALITTQQLLVVGGFCGSALGALFGWMVALALSFLAVAAKNGVGKVALAYQTTGWTGVQDLLKLEEVEPLRVALDDWGRRFSRRIGVQQDHLMDVEKAATTDKMIEILLRGWLCSTVDTLGLLYRLAKKPKYRNRITLIVFGLDGTNPRGRHWISDAGELDAHDVRKEFDTDSIGYRVVTEAEVSPFFFTNEQASNPENAGQNRGGQKYRPFLTFRINAAVVLSIDWPEDLQKDDPFVVTTRELFREDVCPKIAAVLGHWSNPEEFYRVVELNGPLPLKPVEAAPLAKESDPAAVKDTPAKSEDAPKVTPPSGTATPPKVADLVKEPKAQSNGPVQSPASVPPAEKPAALVPTTSGK